VARRPVAPMIGILVVSYKNLPAINLEERRYEVPIGQELEKIHLSFVL
jgi:hypothetical protein